MGVANPFQRKAIPDSWACSAYNFEWGGLRSETDTPVAFHNLVVWVSMARNREHLNFPVWNSPDKTGDWQVAEFRSAEFANDFAQNGFRDGELLWKGKNYRQAEVSDCKSMVELSNIRADFASAVNQEHLKRAESPVLQPLAFSIACLQIWLCRQPCNTFLVWDGK
ncbi:MAG: hypothetical protein Tsb009_23220 [Planctomycetaceae bacterium]